LGPVGVWRAAWRGRRPVRGKLVRFSWAASLIRFSEAVHLCDSVNRFRGLAVKGFGHPRARQAQDCH